VKGRWHDNRHTLITELADQWNAIDANPHTEYSGFHDALASIAVQFGDAIPTMRGDGGPYWEDRIIAASGQPISVSGPATSSLT